MSQIRTQICTQAFCGSRVLRLTWRIDLGLQLFPEVETTDDARVVPSLVGQVPLRRAPEWARRVRVTGLGRGWQLCSLCRQVWPDNNEFAVLGCVWRCVTLFF